jgi:hypothetical protein
MLSITLLPEDIIYGNICLYLNFDQNIILLSCCKFLRNTYFFKLVKLKLNYKDSMLFIVNIDYYNNILNKIYTKNMFKYLCLTLSYSNKTINLENNLILDNLSLIKENFHVICNLNTLNMRFVYNKYFFINELLNIFNIQTLILTCDISEKEELINNLDYLHIYRRIKTIIIEELKDCENDIREILICEKDNINQFVGTKYNNYFKSCTFGYTTIKKYSICGENNLFILIDNLSINNFYYSDDDFVDEYVSSRNSINYSDYYESDGSHDCYESDDSDDRRERMIKSYKSYV